MKPKVFKKSVKPTKEPKVRARGFQEIFPLEIFSRRFFENQLLKRMMTANSPRARPDKKEKNPGPGLAKVPIFKPILCQQAKRARRIKNREERQSFLTANPLQRL